MYVIIALHLSGMFLLQPAGSTLASPGKKPKGNGLSFNSLSLYNSFQSHLADKAEDKKDEIVPTDKK